MLFNLVERKFYIFGLVFWPQDVFYLAILLIISAYALFLFTAVGGRLFCGYACPQTVYTEILMWIEEKIEGAAGVPGELGDAGPVRVVAEQFFRAGLPPREALVLLRLGHGVVRERLRADHDVSLLDEVPPELRDGPLVVGLMVPLRVRTLAPALSDLMVELVST